MASSISKKIVKEFGRDALWENIQENLIHSNVCGPMSDKSLGGHLYYVTFIEDHSRKTCLYLLKKKDEVFEKFKEFRCEVETLTERKIKSL